MDTINWWSIMRSKKGEKKFPEKILKRVFVCVLTDTSEIVIYS